MNGRLDTLQAAVLLSKLEIFDEELKIREKIAEFYDTMLAPAVQIPVRVANSSSAWAIYAILLENSAARDEVQEKLRAHEVPSAIYYPRPLHHQPAYRDSHDGSALPVSEDLATRILALPIHPDLTTTQADYVVRAVVGAVPPPR